MARSGTHTQNHFRRRYILHERFRRSTGGDAVGQSARWLILTLAKALALVGACTSGDSDLVSVDVDLSKAKRVAIFLDILNRDTTGPDSNCGAWALIGRVETAYRDLEHLNFDLVCGVLTELRRATVNWDAGGAGDASDGQAFSVQAARWLQLKILELADLVETCRNRGFGSDTGGVSGSVGEGSVIRTAVTYELQLVIQALYKAVVHLPSSTNAGTGVGFASLQKALDASPQVPCPLTDLP